MASQHTRMTNRTQVLKFIHNVNVKMRVAPSLDERFDLLDNLSLLMQVLQEVTVYENKLTMDLDID